MHMHVMCMLITYMAQLRPQKFIHLGMLCLYAVCFYTGSTVNGNNYDVLEMVNLESRLTIIPLTY